MKVQLISREIVKPSSPNPRNPGIFEINVIGRATIPCYIPLILFYTGNSDCTHQNNQAIERIQSLKKSLSETLTRFYPLAGRMKDNGTVQCNDEGAEFSEAQVDAELSELLERPSLEVLNQMVPCSFSHVESGSDVPLAIQVNHFRCGGLAIGFGMHHQVGDGNSLSNFIHQWVSTARGASEKIVDPDLNSSLLFPVDVVVSGMDMPLYEHVVMRRLVFDASNIAALRSRSASNDLEQAQPTKYEAVSALLWRCLTRAQGKEGCIASASLHAVNMRGRMVPPLPQHSFGNISLMVAVAATGREWGGAMQSQLERKLRMAIRKMDNDYIKRLQGPGGVLKHFEFTETEVKKCRNSCELVCFYFSSWCRFRFYEADFGFGKPVWASICKGPIGNVVLLMDTRSGDGIEVWVGMEDDNKMAKFEQDQELLSFASFKPIFV